MGQFFYIHPDNPQLRLLKEAAVIFEQGGIVVYPTDSTYAIGCKIGNKAGLDRIKQLRELDDKHNFTLICRNLSELSQYAHVNNPMFRVIKAHIPGPYTFILNATKEVPKRLLHPKRNTIGLRVPNNKILLGLLNELNEPLMSASFSIPNQDVTYDTMQEIHERLGNQVDLVIDGGNCGSEPTTIVDLTGGEPELLRQGKGSW